jgi:DNA mismatch endonuclease, patch repair protein
MADTLSKLERSKRMALIRSTGNKATELKFAALLQAAGIKGWRRNSSLPGKPDFVFREGRLAIFVDGCYWHGCPEHCRMPQTNVTYWRRKIALNKRRDLHARRALGHAGWRVLRIWEHELKKPSRCLNRLLAKLTPQANPTTRRRASSTRTGSR